MNVQLTGDSHRGPKQPRFAIVLTTCDRPALLPDALASLREQTCGDFEALIVDDGRPPGCVESMLEDSRFAYLNKRHLAPGVAASRNMGVDLTTAPYLCFLDDDDVLHPEFLSWASAALQSAPGHLVFGDFDLVEEQLSESGRIEISRRTKTISTRDQDTLLVANFIPICAAIIPRLPDLPRFDTSLASHEDWDFLLACRERCPLLGVGRSACEVRQRAAEPDRQRGTSRREFWWLDYLAVYQRHPSIAHATARRDMLRKLGAELPLAALENLGRSRQ
jgi:glycosyltransferase involved in cell wall biosynthesis